MIVYLIRNRVNGKVYVGKTERSLSRRWQNHVWTARQKKSLNWPLYNAIRKYGAEAFTIEPIGEASSAAQLNDLEKSYIALLGSLDPAIGYNRTAGGDGVAGLFKFTVSKDDLARAIQSGMGVQEIADQHHVARSGAGHESEDDLGERFI